MIAADPNEIEKFAQLSQHWWDPHGPLRTLHDINATRLQFIEENCQLANKQVLDLGCGGGILTESLAKAGALTTGVDLEAKAIQVAQAHALENNLQIDYINCPIEDLDLKKTYDVITCMEMLEHVPSPEAILQELKLHLKPGGKIFLSTINRTSKAYLYTIIGAEYLLNLIPKNTHDYKKYIKPSELSNMLLDLDLSIEDIKGLDYNPLTHRAHIVDDVSVNYMLVASPSA